MPFFPQGGSGGSGTVTSIVAGTGLNGGTITTSGTISLASASSPTFIVPAGTNQAGATAMTAEIQVAVTAAVGSGIRLVTGANRTFSNQSSELVAVYPQTGGQIGTSGTNVAVSVPSGATADFYFTSATQWYST